MLLRDDMYQTVYNIHYTEKLTFRTADNFRNALTDTQEIVVAVNNAF